MARIAFAADLHVGNHRVMGGPVRASINRRAQHTIDVLGSSLKIAAREGCDAYVLLGDVFDCSRPEPQLIAAVQNALARYACSTMPVYFMVGNHDQVSDASGDHALGPLANVRHVYVVEEPVVLEVRSPTRGTTELWLLPYRGGNARNWLPTTLRLFAPRRQSSDRALCLHMGLRDAYTPPWLQEAPNSVATSALAAECEAHGVNLAIAGDWHGRRVFQSNPSIVQCGTICPTGFNDAGFNDGRLAIWDASLTEPLAFIQVSGPRFFSSSYVSAMANFPPLASLGQSSAAYLRIVASNAQELTDAHKIARSLVERGFVIDAEAALDARAAADEMTNATRESLKSDSVEQAIAAWVAEMPTPIGVEREAILDRSLRLLRAHKVT